MFCVDVWYGGWHGC